MDEWGVDRRGGRKVWQTRLLYRTRWMTNSWLYCWLCNAGIGDASSMQNKFMHLHKNHDTHPGVGGDEQCGSPRTHGEGETQHKGFENKKLIHPRAFASRAQLDFAPQKLWCSFRDAHQLRVLVGREGAERQTPSHQPPTPQKKHFYSTLLGASLPCLGCTASTGV